MAVAGLAECARPLILRKIDKSAGIATRNPTQRAATRAAAGFKPAERGPGGGLTATYCTPWGRMKMSSGCLGAVLTSWKQVRDKLEVRWPEVAKT